MRRKDRETIEQIKESVEMLKANQRTEEIITQALSANSSLSLPVMDYLSKEEISEEEKIKAAYALNLCTVSVSQIIDYDDIYILEQEYEAILNNLNLEEMPKDNALLSILKQILDTVTFFRIQEGDKKIIELKYQKKIKDAIWSAVPNIGLIFAGGNPATLAISLVSQVGMGYMNYRKEKAKINLEHTMEMWKLQRSAIEQFNGLRRELFDTAWRLADRYNFPDNYRLTERQISQYNSILMDPDDARRFERLLAIEEKFSAYLPYWYYLANSAKSICNSDRLSEENRISYLQRAKDYYKHYLDLDEQFSLLRENSITSACALEYIELPGVSLEEKQLYLNRAVEKSGNAPDILQLCAMSYLSIGDYESAKRIMHGLINEGYNSIVNSQILSLIYANNADKESTRGEYKLLADRVNNDYLVDLPAKGQMPDIEGFIRKQNKILLIKHIIVLKQIHDTYEARFNEYLPRVEDIDVHFGDSKKTKEYTEHLTSIGFSDQLLVLLNSLIELIDNLNIPLQYAKYSIKINLMKYKECIMNYTSPSFLKRLVQMSFDNITKDYFERIIKDLTSVISGYTDIVQISKAETRLSEFCDSIPEIGDINYLYEHIDDTYKKPETESYLKHNLFYENARGSDDLLFKALDDLANKSKSTINCYSVNILTNYDGFYFSRYFVNIRKGDSSELKALAVAVINDESKKNRDLIITKDKFYLVVKGKVKGKIDGDMAKNIYADSEKSLEIGNLISAIVDKRKGIVKENADYFEILISKLRVIPALPPQSDLNNMFSNYDVGLLTEGEQ